ncbi:MAG: transporter substrate-binding domain-containing protein [Deltaproteobacteria bacterium]|jgi:polar amino acid transport system substrate-binding protein|nr:transporter substrate-binding domain-containing protein [Deltaproteobacteria bacterium]
MKLHRVILVSVLVLFAFTACAQQQTKQNSPSGSPVIDRIVDRGELVVGTMGKMPPMNMTTKDGDLIGMEIDLAKSIAAAMGVKARFETMDFSKLLQALEDGKVDMVLSGMTITPKRNMKAAFVGPYFQSGKAFLTKIKTIAEADEAEDVNSADTKLVALKGSTSQAFVEKFIPKATLFTVGDYDEGVDMVLKDKVHAMVADYPICVVSVFRYPDAGLLGVVTPITYEPIGIAVPPGDPLLVNWLENFMATLEGSGWFELLEKRWFARGDWLNKLP